MLPRLHRLTADKDLNRVFKKGRSASGSGFAMRSIVNGKEVSRFAFVVSTKVSKKAVVRNGLKRRMREIVRARLSDMKAGYDVVVTARKEAIDQEFPEMRAAIDRLLKKSGLI